MKIVRDDQGTGFPSFNFLRSTSNWPPPARDIVASQDRVQFMRRAIGDSTYILDAGGFDVRGYFVAGDFGEPDECAPHPVFDVTSQSDPGMRDQRVDTFDFVAFAGCATGANVDPAVFDALSLMCRCMDIDHDEDIDMDDFAGFQRCYTGPFGTIDPGCDGLTP
jgi:hypothetical protein